MDDLISRKAVMKWLMHKDFSDGRATLFDMQEVATIPAAKPRKWIPVSERLPEYGESVLCYYEDGYYGVNHIIDSEDGEWFDDGVIAWMPLPAPYEEESDGCAD